MSEAFYVLILPGKVNTRYPSIEDATSAAKEYLQNDAQHFLMVAIHEISDNAEKRGRVVFLAGGKLEIIELAMS